MLNIQQIAPNLALVLMSGLEPDHYADRIKQLRLAGMRHTPFSVAALRQLIRSTVGDSGVSKPA
jgi:hypothetical protein